MIKHIQSERWQELDNAFWKVLEFGTGGRRGRMYPFGSNTINERTIGESAQGLASPNNLLRYECKCRRDCAKQHRFSPKPAGLLRPAFQCLRIGYFGMVHIR